MSEKPWAGRFNLPTDIFVEEFNASIYFDKRLYKFDIKGSIAHAVMLSRQGIIAESEARAIVSGLEQVLDEIEKGEFHFDIGDEDIHMAVEKRLTEIAGPVGGKLHTARSRNDQVAVDVRMYVMYEAETVKAYLINLIRVLVDKAVNNIGIVMPGFTHLQQGQPILFSHYLMAYFQMFKRDFQRINDLMIRANYCPLGAGALAGTTFPIDRNYTANTLGFYGPTENSIDSVSDRDFIIEFLSAASICMMHLSRLSEEIILFSNPDINFVTLTDDYCTGSSIMPQKKNPDMAELIRGKSGRVYGNLFGLLTVMKSLPLAYNKDLQEDKEGMFDTAETILTSLDVMSGMLATMTVNTSVMAESTEKDFSNATELADYLAAKGLPFRKAHEIVGEMVLECSKAGHYLQDVPLTRYQEVSELIEVDIYDTLNSRTAVARRTSFGGTGFDQVKMQIDLAKETLKNESSISSN